MSDAVSRHGGRRLQRGKPALDGRWQGFTRLGLVGVCLVSAACTGNSSQANRPLASGSPSSVAAAALSPTLPATPSAADGLSTAEAALVARLPEGLVDPRSCVPAPGQEDPISTEAGVDCQVGASTSAGTAGAPTDILVTQDRTAALLAREIAHNFSASAFGSDFAKPPAAGAWKYATDQATKVGTRWLYLDSGNTPHLDWTYDRAGIFVDAQGGTSAAAILSWFSAANLRVKSP